MSAYLSHPYSIGRLAAYAAYHTPGVMQEAISREVADRDVLSADATTGDLAAAVAMVLARAQLASVRARYPDDDDKSLPGLRDGQSATDWLAQCVASARQTWPWDAHPVRRMLGALESYESQCPHAPDWASSAAREIVRILWRYMGMEVADGFDLVPRESEG